MRLGELQRRSGPFGQEKNPLLLSGNFEYLISKPGNFDVFM